MAKVGEDQGKENKIDIQNYYQGLNTVSQPYLLNGFAPYLLNLKFDSFGKNLYRRDGIIKIPLALKGKIVASTQTKDGDIYFIETTGTKIYLSVVRDQTIFGFGYTSIEITSFVDPSKNPSSASLSAFKSNKDAQFNTFVYLTYPSKAFLQVDDRLTSVAVNTLVTVTGITNFEMISHDFYNNALFALIVKDEDYIVAWGKPNSLTLDKNIKLIEKRIYAIRSFGSSIFLYGLNNVYKLIYDSGANTVNIQVYSAGYGASGSKLTEAVGTNIYYYSNLSGLSMMSGVSENAISDVNQIQRPINTYVSNLHKNFSAKKINYKKDDGSIYIIGNMLCNYISEAIHWQNIYCKSKTKMTDAEYDLSLKNFRDGLVKKNKFVLEFNIPLQRYSLHYYEKQVFGFYTMVAQFENYSKEQLVVTEDYIGITESRNDQDAGENFPVQFNTVPVNRGLFQSGVSTVFNVHVKFASNNIPEENENIYITSVDMPLSILRYPIKVNREDTLIYKTEGRISNSIRMNTNFTSDNPSHLIGIGSESISVLDGAYIDSKVTAMHNI